MAHKVGIIGLGVVGRRTLANLAAHDGFEVAAAWDVDPGARAAAARDVPGLAIAADAAAVIGSPAEVIYIATPPLHHHDYVVATLAAGKAIFCEKPLGIDVGQSRALTDRVEASGLESAVNFVYGSAPAALALGRAVEAGELGTIDGIDIRLHFASWPRGWQEGAAWLKGREQGASDAKCCRISSFWPTGCSAPLPSRARASAIPAAAARSPRSRRCSIAPLL